MRKEKTSQNDKMDRKKYPILDYIARPIIYVLVSMIVVLPMSFFLLNTAVDTVHDLQKSFTMSYSELKPQNKIDKSLSPSELGPAMYVGSIESKDIGIKCKVYNGINRVSLRQGAAMSTEDSAPGSGKTTCVFGYATSSFAKLSKAKEGDIITFATYWGEFEYQVVGITKSKTMPSTSGETLVLCTDISDQPFACTSDKALYVTATPVTDSGEEAQHE